MAKTTALLLTVLLGFAEMARARETDPARRSLVVEAVERASPAVVNISTEQVTEGGGSPFPFPEDPLFDEFFRKYEMKLSLDVGPKARNALAGQTVVRPLEKFCRNAIQC